MGPLFSFVLNYLEKFDPNMNPYALIFVFNHVRGEPDISNFRNSIVLELLEISCYCNKLRFLSQKIPNY